MLVNELIAALLKANGDNRVVIGMSDGDGYTTDIGISYDDNGDVELYEIAGAKGY